MIKKVILLFCIWNILFQTDSIVRADQEAHYCGIYAIYGASKALGKNSDFQSLISEKYVSDRRGSSAYDLHQAAIHLGIELRSFRGLGVQSLKKAKDPLILHVTSEGQLQAQNHWVLFLGIEENQARIIDSARGIRLISLSKLCARWDGIGLVAFNGDQPLVNYEYVEVQNFIHSGLLPLVILLGLCGLGFLRSSTFLSNPFFVISFTTMSIMAYDLSNPNSILRSHETNDYIFATLKDHDFTLVNYDELNELLVVNKDLLLVDARIVRDFERGSLPNAINVSVEISEYDMENKLQEIDRQTPICVYCLHSGCSYDLVVAKRLLAFGFKDVIIYKDGYVDWVEHKKKKPANP